MGLKKLTVLTDPRNARQRIHVRSRSLLLYRHDQLSIGPGAHEKKLSMEDVAPRRLDRRRRRDFVSRTGVGLVDEVKVWGIASPSLRPTNLQATRVS